MPSETDTRSLSRAEVAELVEWIASRQKAATDDGVGVVVFATLESVAEQLREIMARPVIEERSPKERILARIESMMGEHGPQAYTRQRLIEIVEEELP